MRKFFSAAIFFLLSFTFASVALCQYEMELERPSRSSGYIVGFEIKPLPAVMYGISGGYGYGAELEVALLPDIVFTGSYTAMGADPKDEEFAKQRKKAEKKNDDEIMARRFDSQIVSAGLRWYAERNSSSFYAGARGVQTLTKTDYVYDDDSEVTDQTTAMGAGIEMGYRWLFDFVSLRLGLGGQADTSRQSKTTVREESSANEAALTRYEDDRDEKKEKKTRFGGTVDIGLGIVF